MKSKAQKKQELDRLKQDLERARHVIVSSFSKLTVSQEYELRKQVRAAGGKYRVVKNTLAERAARGTPAWSLPAAQAAKWVAERALSTSRSIAAHRWDTAW